MSKNYISSNEQLERLLKHALSCEAEPDEELNRKIKIQADNKRYKRLVQRRAAVVLIAAAIFIMSGSVFAAWKFLSPKQVADYMGHKPLAKAFESENAVLVNKSAVCGDYIFTLLGITSGSNLNLYNDQSQEIIEGINPDKTYAVISIARKDGKPLPEFTDEFYLDNGFIVTPFIKGLNPWEVNIFAMNGGYRECLIDGVIYRMLECDSIEIFADRGVYLYVSTGRSIDNRKIIYNTETGEILLNPDNEEAGALFELPLDLRKADPVKADQYLKELLEPEDVGGTEEEPLTNDENDSANEDSAEFEDLSWDEEFADAVVIPGTLKELTIDEEGFVYYEYVRENGRTSTGSSLEFLLEFDLKDAKPGEWRTQCVSYDDEKPFAIQFSIDENGVIWGRVVTKPD